MKTKLVEIISEQLSSQIDQLREQFSNSIGKVGIRHAVLDDLLPDTLAHQIHTEFPRAASMRLMDSFRERKYTSKSFNQFAPIMADITFALQDPKVIKVIEQITGIEQQIPDSSLYAGGLSAMGLGHFLGPHIDNSHEISRTYYRTLNLLYYVTPGWSVEDGGNLELWDRDVRRHVTIVSKFNRLAIMETNPWSWHSVSEVTVDRLRCCVSNYYFSPSSPTGHDYFNVTSFSARPEQRMRRALAWADGRLRQAVRQLVPQGLGKKDVYKGPAK